MGEALGWTETLSQRMPGKSPPCVHVKERRKGQPLPWGRGWFLKSFPPKSPRWGSPLWRTWWSQCPHWVSKGPVTTQEPWAWPSSCCALFRPIPVTKLLSRRATPDTAKGSSFSRPHGWSPGRAGCGDLGGNMAQATKVTGVTIFKYLDICYVVSSCTFVPGLAIVGGRPSKCNFQN